MLLLQSFAFIRESHTPEIFLPVYFSKRMKTVTWYIFNVLGKKKHVSPTFLEAGFEWHIEAYPNGIDETCKG